MIASEELYKVVSDGHYIYKYSPTAAIFFMPLTLLPYGLAKFVYWISLTFLLIVVLQKLYNQIIVLVALGLLYLKFEKKTAICFSRNVSTDYAHPIICFHQ